MSPAVKTATSQLLLVLLLGGCSYTVKPLVVAPSPGPASKPLLLALLSPIDVREQKGGVKTHQEERFVRPQPYNRYIYPLDPWNDVDPPPTMRPQEETRVRPTGEVGTDEILIPTTDSFARRLKARVG